MTGFGLLPAPPHRSPEPALRSRNDGRGHDGGRNDARRMLAAHLGGDPRARSRRRLRRAGDQGARPPGARGREPDPEDELIARLGDPAWSQWMHENFFSPETFPSSGTHAATRRDCSTTRAAVATSSRGSSNGSAPTRNRGRRRSPPSSRCSTRRTSRASACSTSGRRPGRLELVVYAHSLDFGKKAYGNLVELARLQELRRRRARAPARLAHDLRQVGARLRARVGADGAARRGGPAAAGES